MWDNTRVEIEEISQHEQIVNVGVQGKDNREWIFQLSMHHQNFYSRHILAIYQEDGSSNHNSMALDQRF